MSEYRYGMKHRYFAIGCQPMEGFLQRLDDESGRYFDIIVYDRPLSANEIADYELEDLNIQSLHEYGYTGPAADILTDDEISKLIAGKSVITYSDDKYGNRYNCLYIALQYSEKTHLVYTCNKWVNSRSNDYKIPLKPEKALSYIGFITNKKLFIDTKGIIKSIFDDLNIAVLERIPNEETALEMCDQLSDFELDRIQYYDKHDYTDSGRKLFCKDEIPELNVIESDISVDSDDVIKYIEDPQQMIFELTNKYVINHLAHIVQNHVSYNRLRTAYDNILTNPQDEAHLIKKIVSSIGDQKTVRLLLDNNETVKVEAHAVKSLSYSNYISDWYVASADRHKLSSRNIRADMIKAIYHGRKTLYQVA